MYNSSAITYTSGMATFPVSDARQRLAEIVDLAQTEAVVIERYGKPAAVVLSHVRYEQLMDALEELEDADAIDAAMAEDAPDVPWESLKAEFGWP